MENEAEQSQDKDFNIKFAIAIIFGFEIPNIYSRNDMYNHWQVELSEEEILILISILENLNLETSPFLYNNYHVSDFRHGTYHIFFRTGAKWYTSNAFRSRAYTLKEGANLRETFEVLRDHTANDFPTEKTLTGIVTLDVPILDREFKLECRRREDGTMIYKIIHERWVRKTEFVPIEN